MNPHPCSSDQQEGRSKLEKFIASGRDGRARPLVLAGLLAVWPLGCSKSEQVPSPPKTAHPSRPYEGPSRNSLLRRGHETEVKNVVILIGRLKDHSYCSRLYCGADIRYKAAEALGALGPAAEDAVPYLARQTGSYNPAFDDTSDKRWVGDAALEALQSIGTPQALWAVRRYRLSLLVGQNRPAPHEPGDVPALMRDLKMESNNRLRDQAIVALGNIGPEAAPAAELLAEAVGNTCDDTQVDAARALGKIGPGASVAVPTLVRLMHRKKTRSMAVVALEDMGPVAKMAMPALISALKDPDWHVREWAAAALGNIGPDASVAVPALRRALRDRDRDVRKTAEQALQKIEHLNTPRMFR